MKVKYKLFSNGDTVDKIVDYSYFIDVIGDESNLEEKVDSLIKLIKLLLTEVIDIKKDKFDILSLVDIVDKDGVFIDTKVCSGFNVGDRVQITKITKKYNSHYNNVGLVGTIKEVYDDCVDFRADNGSGGAVDIDCIKKL